MAPGLAGVFSFLSLENFANRITGAYWRWCLNAQNKGKEAIAPLFKTRRLRPETRSKSVVLDLPSLGLTCNLFIRRLQPASFI